MASVCKNLRLARLSANCIHLGLVVRRPLTASAYCSLIRPSLGANPRSTVGLVPRNFHNIALKPAADMPEAIMETREASPAHMLIKIDSYWLLDKYRINKYETGEFKAGGYKWKLIIYPNGHRNGIDGYVSVNLAMADNSALPPNWEVNASFSICLFNHISGNYRYSLGKTRRFHPLKREWGFTKFISKRDLTDPLNGYLVDNNCVFGAEVFVNENKAVTECLSLKNVTVPYKREFKIPNFASLLDVWLSDEIWASDVFTAGGYKWKTSLRLNRSGKSLSLFVQRVDSENSRERVKACYTACLKNQGCGYHVRNTSSDWFTASSSSWGWESFIELSTLNDPTKGYVVNDCCHLDIELSVQAVAG